MSKTTGMSGLVAGINSAAATRSDAVASRLAQFEKFAPIQYEANKVLTDQQKAEKRAEVFSDTALGLQTAPSNTNLYESHYQLVKDKANLLFSDEVISNYAKDKRSQIEWAQKVDALNQEIAAYEAYYEDSIGDPSKANGLGNTWTDHTVRSKHQGGEKGFWSDQGVESDRTSELNEVMKVVDSRQHGSMKFNYETGEFEYDELQSNVDVFNVNPQTANELFSYNLTQTSFATPSDYATDPKLSKVTGDRTQFDQRLQSEMGKDSFRRAVAQNYINANPDAGLTIDDVMNDEVRFQDAYEDFADETYDFMESNARQSRRSSGGGGRSNTAKPSFGDAFSTDRYAAVSNTAAPLKLTITAENQNTGLPVTGTVKVQNIAINESGIPVAIDNKGTEFPIQGAVADQIMKTIGEDAYVQMMFSLENQAGMQEVQARADRPAQTQDQGEQSWFKSMKDSLGNTRSVNLDSSKASADGGALTQTQELVKLQELAGKEEEEVVKYFQNNYNDNYSFEQQGAFTDEIVITDNDDPSRQMTIGVDESDPKKRQGIANAIFRFMNPQIYDR